MRLRCLDLCAEFINQNRAVFKLGVYLGEFAQKIDGALPNRELYLLNTFEGFDAKDALIGRKFGLSDEKQDFSKTIIKKINAELLIPDRCRIVQVYFPENASVLNEETLTFVSLDVDFCKSIRTEMEWFHERLVPGGFCFVHDYNND